MNNILESEHQTLDLRMGLVHYRSAPPPPRSYAFVLILGDDAAIIHRKTIPTLPDCNK